MTVSDLELSKPTKPFHINSPVQHPLLLETFLTEKRPLRNGLFEQREDSLSAPALAGPDSKTWVVKKEPPALYIPLRKREELTGHFVNLGDTGSTEGEGDSPEDSEMMWIEDAKDGMRSGNMKGVREEFQWPSWINRGTHLGKNSFYSLPSGQM